MQFADKAGPDLGLHCPLTESVDTVVYVDKQRMSRSNCTDVYAVQNLHSLQRALVKLSNPC